MILSPLSPGGSGAVAGFSASVSFDTRCTLDALFVSVMGFTFASNTRSISAASSRPISRNDFFVSPRSESSSSMRCSIQSWQAVKTNDEMVSLTDLWKAAGGDPKQKPAHWVQQDNVQAFITSVEKKEKVRRKYLFKAVTGRTGGTYAHWQIALAYAKYLSPEMHMAANAVFRGYVNADPAMAASIAM